MADDFAHLHFHSNSSERDSICKIGPAVDRAVELGQPALALTDHGHLAAAVKFSQACEDKPIKSILGFEGYITLEDPYNYQDGTLAPVHDASVFSPENKAYKRYHATLLAKNEEGYKNLCYLSSMGYIHGFYQKPRISMKDVIEHSEGLIYMTGCPVGMVYRWMSRILGGDQEYRPLLIKTMRDLHYAFGDDFYIEIMNTEYRVPIWEPEVDKKLWKKEPQDQFNRHIREFADAFQYQTVATSDVHYITPEQRHSYVLWKHDCNKQRFHVTQGKGIVSGNYHLRTRAEMEKLIPWKDSLDNTLVIADKCNFSITQQKIEVPALPNSIWGVDKDVEVDSWEKLQELTWEGYEKLWSGNESAKKQIEYELEIIHEMDYDDYFLLNWHIVNYARSKGIEVGPGRGSGAGSRVARALSITEVDPERFDLYFERFLNPERKSMPDFDLDFDAARRNEIIDYLKTLFGYDHVARIGNIGTAKPRRAINHIFSVLAKPKPNVTDLNQANYMHWEEEYLAVHNAIAFQYDTNVLQTLTDCFTNNKKIALNLNKPDFVKRYYKPLLDIEDSGYSMGIHAAGVVVSPKSLIGEMPLRYDKTTDTYICQFDKDDVEHVGALKTDLLGVKTLTATNGAITAIKEKHGVDVSIENLDLHDARAFKFLCTMENREEIFQILSSSIAEAMKRMQPQSIEDISVVLALHRPGPMDAIDPNTGITMENTYYERREGKLETSYIIPELEEALKDTYGVIVYQEHIMRIARELCKWSLGEADNLRYAVGKKKPKMIKKLKPKFLEDCVKHTGANKAQANEIWDQIETFAGYGFPKAHAVSYAHITYQTAYLKTMYPEEYISAMINTRAEESRAKILIGRYIGEAFNLGIKVQPPTLHSCFSDCHATSRNSIQIGLRGVSGLNKNASKYTELTAQRYPDCESLIDFAVLYQDPSSLPPGQFKTLAKVGFFDPVAFGPGDKSANRNWLVENIPNVFKKIGQIRKRKKPTDEEKMELIHAIEMPAVPALDPWKDHHDQMFHFGFVVDSDNPFNREFSTTIKKLKSWGALDIGEAYRTARGDNKDHDKWEFVAVTAVPYLYNDQLMLEDGRTFCSTVSITCKGKADPNRPTGIQAVSQLTKLAGSGDKQVVLVRGKYLAKKDKDVFRIDSFVLANTINNPAELDEFANFRLRDKLKYDKDKTNKGF